MKQYIIYSIPLAILWCFVNGDVSVVNFIFGLILSPIVIKPFKSLYNFESDISIRDKLRRIPKQLKYLAMLIKEIIKANILVAKIVLQPRININPGIIEVPIRAKTDVGITAIANTITLTPGTLSIDVADDRSVLYVHAIDIDDRERIRASIANMEKYILEALE
ncbi:MAG: Na+/H+ antiporter subunit E [Methanohalobium sp.]|uniref:Na+/H+ antiporter subunit E n=1 Tax=Methanohalobium sp. TaxID=2837493 RepID=UPI0039797DC4